MSRMLVVSRHLTDSFRSTYGDIRAHVDEYRKHIVGVDLCGLDRMTPEFRATFGRHPVQWDFRWLRDFCSHVRSVGLRLTAHAGEFSSPEPIRWALDLGAERIGHGIQAAGHLDLEATLIERSITLEVCPLSNYRTGAVALGAAHPLKRLLKAGVPVTINTDDPSVQNSDWRGEYEFAKSHLGLSEADISRCIQNAVRASSALRPQVRCPASDVRRARSGFSTSKHRVPRAAAIRNACPLPPRCLRRSERKCVRHAGWWRGGAPPRWWCGLRTLFPAHAESRLRLRVDR